MVPRYISIDTAVSRLLSWLQSCEQAHTSCTTGETILPPRVLDISGDMARLVEFQNDETPYGVYVTLSHCWGDPNKSKPTTTTKTTLDSRKAGIAYDDLSPVFRDAIQLCKGVGCGYIWIDSLCIIQDDISDWMTQSQKMAQIYSNAHFNIAATLSPDSTQSLFQERWSLGASDDLTRYPVLTHEVEVSSTANRHVYTRLSHQRDHYYVQLSMADGRSAQAPLTGRAWVFQETLLARRVLHVCASELIWECKTLYTCECGSIGSPFQQKPTGPTPIEPNNSLATPLRKQEFAQICDSLRSTQAAHDFWLTAVNHYASLHLTRPSDRAAALAGLANAIQGVTDGEYCAGIWIDDLARSLLWARIPGTEAGASRSNVAPTWSWMSMQTRDGACNISYGFLLIRDFRQELTTTIHSLINPSTSTPSKESGDIPSEVIFQGPAISARVVAISGPTTPKFYLRPTSDYFESSGPGNFEMEADCPNDPSESLQDGAMVECLLVGTGKKNTMYQYILVVRKYGPGTGVDSYYKRIGVCRLICPGFLSRNRGYFKDAEIKTIKII